MADIKIITDTTAYISNDFAQKNNIGIVPLSINFEGAVQKEGFPGDFDDFFEKLKASQDFPKTSQPAVGEFVNVFEKAVKEGNEVIAILISSKLSGTYNSACMAADMVDSNKISVIDSKTSVSNLKYLVQCTKQMIDKGYKRREIVRVINEKKKRTSAALTVDTLEYLKKGGRLTSSQAFVGSLLNIKPIIILEDGKLVADSKVRGKKKAIQTIIKKVPPNVKNINICHIWNIDEARKIKKELEEKFDDVCITIDIIGPVIGSHLGPKMIGVCYSW